MRYPLGRNPGLPSKWPNLQPSPEFLDPTWSSIFPSEQTNSKARIQIKQEAAEALKLQVQRRYSAAYVKLLKCRTTVFKNADVLTLQDISELLGHIDELKTECQEAIWRIIKEESPSC
ncbi:hypothetical protein WDW89_25965 [Deltaproteobacteria bacterium TL4]